MEQMAKQHANYEDAEWNPLAPDRLENPYDMYRQARLERPIFYSPVFGLWYATRHEDVVDMLQQPKLFSSDMAYMATTSFAPEVEAELAKGYPIIGTLVDNDPPSHTRFKKLVGKVFTPQRIAEREEKIRALAHELIDTFAAEGEADIARRFSFLLPMYTIGDILGIPREDMPNIKLWSDDWLLIMSASAPNERLVEAAKSLVKFQMYIKEVYEQRLKEPREDYISALIQVREEGETPLSDHEIICLVLQMMFAGHETATNLINSTMWLLCQHPEQLEAIRQNPALAAAAIEEGLRLESPVPGLVRTLTEDTVYKGVPLPKGARIMLMFASANRDEEKFQDAPAFDIHRTDGSDHLGFGKGIHYCVAAPLARMECRIAVQALIERLPNLHLKPDQPPIEHIPILVMRGIKSLWLAWDPA